MEDNLFQIFGLFIQAGLLIIAILALNTWRRELQGKNEYETAFNLLLAVRRLYKEIQDKVRNPFLQPITGKGLGAKNWNGDVYASRFGEFDDFKTRLYDKAALRAEILFGKEVKSLLEELEEKIKEIRIAALRLYHGYVNTYEDEDLERENKNKMQKNRELLLNINEEDDYSVSLKKIIEKVEKFLYPKME